jgi:hypothetical protein
MGVDDVANEGPGRRSRNGATQMGMLPKHVQSDSMDFVKRTDNYVRFLIRTISILSISWPFPSYLTPFEPREESQSNGKARKRVRPELNAFGRARDCHLQYYLSSSRVG